MIIADIIFEVTDKEPTLWLFLLYSLSIGAAGMLVARRRPILCIPAISLVLLGAFALALELGDPYVGVAILHEGGLPYVSGYGLAVLAGVSMPVLGAFVGAKHLEKRMAAWRWTLGASGAALLGLTFFVGSGFMRTAYYEYIFWPKEKAGEGYIMPLRWQDIVANLSIGCALVGLIYLSSYLLRAAARLHQQRDR